MNKTFTAAMNEFFGKKEGQTMSDFSAELKKLDDNDRQWFVNEFKKTLGWVVTLAPRPVA